MNGTIYEEIKKNVDSKKRDKIKLIMTLISTNLLVAILCLSFGEQKSSPPRINDIIKTLHPHYKMIVVPLTALVELDQNKPEIPITLLNKSKKILIQKAFFHEAIPASNKDLESITRFKIEIPEEEVMQISADNTEVMIAIPEVKQKERIKTTSNKRVSHYEINL